jgi:DNA-binding NarL/FixJ family response regulator
MNCPACGHDFSIADASCLLTPREIETVTLLLSGHSSNKKIAEIMGTTEQVVKNRFGSIFRKLGLRRRIDLIKFNSTELAGLQ